MTQNTKCDSLQEKVKDIVLSEKDKFSNQRIITLRGFAGTGKTFTASQIIQEMKAKYPKKRIGVFAPTASALSNLKSKLPSDIGISFNTLSSIMQRPVSKLTILRNTFILKEDNLTEIYEYLDKIKLPHHCIEIKKEFSKDFRTGSVKEKIVIIPNIDFIRSQLTMQFRKDMSKEVKEETDFEFLDIDIVAKNISAFDLIVIDEISMISDIMMNNLELAIEFLMMDEKYPQLLLCGDGGQLKQVEGEPNKFVIEKVNDETIFELTKIYRSTDEISHLSSFVRKKFPLKNLNVLRPNTVFETNGTIADLIMENKEILQNSDCVLSFTNEVIDKVNSFIRLVKGYSSTSGVKKGERILVTKNTGRINGEIAFSNGEQWAISEIYSIKEMEGLLIGLREEFNKEESVVNSIDTILNSFNLEEPVVILVLLENKLGIKKKAWIRYDLTDKKMSFLDRTIAQDIDALYKLVENPDIFPCFVPCTFAYAMTVHKAQGSEFDNVVYIVSDRDLRIANISGSATNLSYTAITRAKKDIKIIYRTNIE